MNLSGSPTFVGAENMFRSDQIESALFTEQLSQQWIAMLITKDFHDVPTKLEKNGRPVRIFVISPKVPDYPQAKFPGTPPNPSLVIQ